MAMDTTVFDYDDISFCFTTCEDPCNLFCQANRTFVNGPGTATYVEVRLDFGRDDPFGPVGADWLSKVCDGACRGADARLARSSLPPTQSPTSPCLWVGAAALGLILWTRCTPGFRWPSALRRPW